MPSKSDALGRWLNDIAYHIAKAQAFAGSMSYEAFLEDDLSFLCGDPLP